MIYSLVMHILQSPEWGEFKTKIGTKAVRVKSSTESQKGIQYTKHKIPLTNKYMAYSPKVNPELINFGVLKKSLIEEDCVAINFDVPNLEVDSKQQAQSEKLLQGFCVKSPRSTFAKANIILDISRTEEEILIGMHKKHRYNIAYAQKQGVNVREGKNQLDFEIFYKLLLETSNRQRYYIHPKSYYQTLWDLFSKRDLAHILIAEYKNEPLTAWMLFTYEEKLYYPYGGSSEKYKNLQHSLAVAWEAIRLGKRFGCNTFDMWGASENPEDGSDPWHGFTQFKLKFGGKYVKYIDSYDFVIDKSTYAAFNLANQIRWFILKLFK
uniref:Peptidoglycan bridge formation glycyltransferase FemA/FemB family protein n=1 Tax=candidate division WWE3 bacterium TaxID=2053526 RepID=A0A7C4XVF0_UNCKA